MAKQYHKNESGLYLPGNDSIVMPKPKIPRPWYAGKYTPLSGRAAGQIKFVGDPAKVLFTDDKVCFNPDCCCEPSYTGCESYNDLLCDTASWTIDLGAGGWSDVKCSYCDQIAGEYVLEYTGSGCKWDYEELDVCEVAGYEGVKFSIVMIWDGDTVGELSLRDRLFVEVWLQEWPYNYIDPFWSRANYISEVSSGTCDDLADENGDIVLSPCYSTYRGWHDPHPFPAFWPCSGSLPETIKVHR
jgi:hypothetical protein